MSIEKANEFKTYIQGLITANGEDTFSKRVHWKDFPEKITNNAVQAFNIPVGETMIMMLDSSVMGSGKEGMVLTDWGVRYNNDSKAWNLTWNDLQEKFALSKFTEEGSLGINTVVISLQVKEGDDPAVNKIISLSMASINCDLLAIILDKACLIFTGKGVKMKDSFIWPEKKDPNKFDFEHNDLHTVITLEGDSVVIKKFKVDDKKKTEKQKGEPVTIKRSAIASIKIKRIFSIGPVLAGIVVGAIIGFAFFGGVITLLIVTALSFTLAFPKRMTIIRKDGTKYKTTMSYAGAEYERFINVIFE